jgi:hypothetical protein
MEIRKLTTDLVFTVKNLTTKPTRAHMRPSADTRRSAADTKQLPTRGRVLDHIGFDVTDHEAFVKLRAEGIKLEEPVRKSAAGNTITYITDPWGTRIEIVQRAPLGPEVH